jgi:broad specificity phosphatase PhoE
VIILQLVDFIACLRVTMPRVVFLRHAESAFNVDPQSTILDCPLTERGQQQASQLTGHYPLVITSPLLRARQMLDLSQITYSDLRVSLLVREHQVDPCDFLDGESPTSIETEEDLIRRGDQFLEKLKTLASYPLILVVSHCEFICSITGESPDNTGTSVIDLDVPSVNQSINQSSD